MHKNTNSLLTNIKSYISLNQFEIDLFLSKLEFKTYKKKEYFNLQNQYLENVAFVLKGCLRSFHLDKNGVEHILQFAPENYWISDMYAFVFAEKSILNIEAIETTEVLVLSRANQLKLFDEIPQFERFFRIITEKSIVKNHFRMINNRSLTALERFEVFCKDYPDLINRLSQKHIASYIGVTPEFLSKIKSEFIKK